MLRTSYAEIHTTEQDPEISRISSPEFRLSPMFGLSQRNSHCDL
jgi:hypothetical protein